MWRCVNNRGRRAVAVAASAVGLAGCAGQLPGREHGGPFAGNQGGSWEVVLPGRAVASADGPGPEQGRRDDDLNIRPIGPRLALETWPEEDRPSLDRARRLAIPRRSHQYLYLSDRPRHRHRYWHWWW